MMTLVARLVALAVVQQTIELVQLQRVCAEDGIWRARSRAAYRAYVALLWLRLFAASFAIVQPHAALLGVLLVTSVLLALRWRGSFNGGSDYMTIVLLSAATLALSWPRAERGATYYVAIVACNSYFIAGIAKLRTWRSGDALRGFVQRSLYQPPPALLVRLARPASWLTLVLECGFPLVLVSPSIARVVLPVMLVFHIANAWLFGLNRFVLVWLATYPAIWAAVSQ